MNEQAAKARWHSKHRWHCATNYPPGVRPAACACSCHSALEAGLDCADGCRVCDEERKS